MKCWVIPKNDLEGRLDAFFYQPEFIEMERKIKAQSSRRLGDFVLEISGGATPDTSEQEKYYADGNGGVPFLRVQNLDPSGELQLNDVKYINEKTHNGLLKRSQVQEGNLLVKITGVGRMAVSSVIPEGFLGNINQHIAAIKTKDRKTSEILAAFLNSDIGERLATRRSTGGTRPALDYPALKSIPVIFNPKAADLMHRAYEFKKKKEDEAEQLLNSVDDYIFETLGIKKQTADARMCFTIPSPKVQGKRLDPLFYSRDIFHFIASLKYKPRTVFEVSEFLKTGFAAGKASQSKTGGEAIIQIRPTNLGDQGKLKFEKNILIEARHADENGDDLIQRGEVLFNNTNSQDLVGKSAYFDLPDRYFCSNHITRIKVKEAIINPRYLSLILNLYQHSKVFFNICTNWNNQSGVNAKLLGTLPIPLPPRANQDRIADEIKNRMQKAEAIRKSSQADLEQAKAQVEKIILGN